MIFTPININEPHNWEIDLSQYNTWEEYYKQYVKVFDLLCELAKLEKYCLNQQFMPFLFICRHTLELFLKKDNYNSTDNYHDLRQLIGSSKSPEAKCNENQVSVLNCDSSGDCFRYIKDKNNSNFYHGEQLSTLKTINYLRKLFDLEQLKTTNRLKWELTFHTFEIKYIGIIATQYQTTISFLIDKVNSGDVALSEIALPLLFLIRHAFELLAKHNIECLTEDGKSIKIKNNKAHSLEYLHITKLLEFYKKAEDNCCDKALRNRIISDREIIEKLVNSLATTDKDSLHFRFPVDKDNNSWNHKNPILNIAEIYNLLKRTDSILSFGIGYFINEGYLQ